jgi:hypothetical protein
MGGYQAIWLNRYEGEASASGRRVPIQDVYRGASDHRKDGAAEGW